MSAAPDDWDHSVPPPIEITPATERLRYLQRGGWTIAAWWGAGSKAEALGYERVVSLQHPKNIDEGITLFLERGDHARTRCNQPMDAGANGTASLNVARRSAHKRNDGRAWGHERPGHR